MNLEAADEEHTRLNQAVIQRAKTIAQLTGMKVALVSTISGKVDFKSYIEDADADLSTNEEIIGAYYGLDPADIYLSDDKPKKAIIKTSKNINADIVVIGSVGRSGISGALIGNTAEKILDKMDRKVLIIVENLPVPFDTRVWQEATTLVENGYTVSVICPKGKGFTKDYEQLSGVHIYRHDLPEEGNGFIGYVKEYYAALREELRLAKKIQRLWKC